MRRTAAIALALVLALAVSGAAPAATGTLMRKANLRGDNGFKARGEALIVKQGSQIGLFVNATRMRKAKAGQGYAVWLLNRRGKARLHGFITSAVSSRGRLQSASRISRDRSRPRRMVLTLETATRPKSPGRVVLRGTFRRPRGR